MSDRRAQIVRLLETRDDHLPAPTRRDHSTAGFVHHAPGRESCPDCLANDRVMFGCETCGGRGYLEEIRHRDPYAVEKVQPYGIDQARHERTRERDAQIDRLEQQTRVPWKSEADELADANAHPEGWELARRRMYQAFDYAALDVALEQLRDRDEGAYRMLHSVWIYKWQQYPSAPIEAACERGLAFLDLVLPDPLRAPGDQPASKLATGRVARAAGAKAFEERDTEIRRAIDAGIATEDVARTWKITARQVNRIIARLEAA